MQAPESCADAADDSLRLLHELQVHQAELAQQNEELEHGRRALAASLQRYIDLYEQAPVGLVTADRRGVILQINECGRLLLADGDPGLVGRSLPDLVEADDRDAVWRWIAAPVAPLEGRNVELAVSPPSGVRRMLHAEARSNPNDDGSLLLALSDVTARRLAESELERTRHILKLSNRVARIGFWEYDVDQDRLHWSAMTNEIHGMEPDNVPTIASALAFYKAGGDRQRLRSAMAVAMELGRSYDLELQIHTAQGRDVWVRCIGFSERVGGRTRRMYGTFQDIDQRVKAEQARVAQVQADAANRSKSVFLARMSHDLRTPTHAVLGFAQLLALDDAVSASPTAVAQVDYIRAAGQHLLAMIDDLLDITRIEDGKLAVSSEVFTIGPVIDECLALTAALAQQHGVAVQSRVTDPLLGVAGDARRLRQVVLNLLSNAIKYNCADGAVDIEVFSEPGRVVIAVGDTGPGLTPAQLADMFQPFNRLGAERGGVEGTGLGLVIARHLTEAMKGTLAVQSTPGVGSVFTLGMPSAAAGEVAAAASLAAAVPDLAEAGPAQPVVVLYVEDNPVNVALMRHALNKRETVRLEVATDGEAGVEAVQRLHPDLVLLDMGLPRLDGFGVLQRLRADPSVARIPCVAVSANAMPAEIERTLQAGAVDYITKPFSVEQVLLLVDRLGRQAAPRP